MLDLLFFFLFHVNYRNATLEACFRLCSMIRVGSSTARFQRCFNDQKRCKASQISDHVGSNSVVQLLKDGAKVNWTIDNPY